MTAIIEYEKRFKETFAKDLKLLCGIYGSLSLNELIKSADFLIKMHDKWEKAFHNFTSFLGITTQNQDLTPYLLERESLAMLRAKPERARATMHVLEFAGPGAVGKETIEKELGFPKVKITTTRPRRNYETDQYHFLNDQNIFEKMAARGEFVITSERPGRGWYGVQRKDLNDALAQASVVIIEENPATLMKLSEAIKGVRPEANLTIVYILPPPPLILHLGLRLAKRCIIAGEDYRTALESTLGERQIHEFESLRTAHDNGTDVLYVVNDSIQRTKDIIRLIV
jgi:guanylate kinase